MSKSLLPFVAVSGLMLTACNARVHQIDLEPQTAQVTVHLSNFSISQDDYPSTRATQDVSDYAGVKSLVLAFFKPDGPSSIPAVWYPFIPSGPSLTAAGDATVCSLIGTAYRAFIIIYSVRLSVLQDN